MATTERLWCGRRILTGLALALALSAGIWVGGAAAVAESTGHRVVVSVLPLHSLVAAVMAGTGAPFLLVRGASSPHDASLRPSDARALTRAQVVVWAGPALEVSMIKSVEVLARDARVVTLTAETSLHRLPLPGASADAAMAPGTVDPHLWLDPVNAKRMAEIFAAALAETDPDNSAIYRANAARLAARLDALDAELRARLAPVREAPHVVFHDAYAYFEARYGLNRVGAFTVNPEIRPGVRHLSALRDRIREFGVACVFTEPQVNPARVTAMTEGTGVRIASLDPLGATLAPGPEAYFTLMRTLADSLVACLEGG